MPGDQNDSSTSFIRQRRDLFVISAVLIIGQLTDLEIKKFSFFGTEIDVHNSKIFIQAAWVLWFYWLIRYWQAFRKTSGQSMITEEYRGIKATGIQECALRFARKEIKKLIADKDATSIDQPCIHERGYKNGKYYLTWTAPAVVQGSHTRIGPFTIDTIPLAHVLWVNLKAAFFLCINEIEVTEYLVPFLFSQIPIYIFLYKLF